MTLAGAGALAAALAMSSLIFAPFARRGLVPSLRVAHPDGRHLNDAGWRYSRWRWEALRAGCILAGAALSLAVPVPLLGVVGLAALGPSFLVRWRAAAARRRAGLAVTRLLRATEAALRSGAPVPEALRRATQASEDRLARRPFVDALRAFDLGAPLDQALRSAACGLTIDARSRLAFETLAIGIESRLPSDRAAILIAAAADRLSFEERLDEEVHARTGGLRAQVVLLALVVPAIAVYLALTVPSLAATLGQPIGRFVLVPAAAALEVIGVIASRRATAGTRP
jgi:Flp pilus assembly protein TadB